MASGSPPAAARTSPAYSSGTVTFSAGPVSIPLMIRTSAPSVIVAGLLAALVTVSPAHAQVPLTLQEAIARATAGNLDARIAALAEKEAAHRVDQARAGYLPRVDASETWHRGNQPVFVFGSLLNQRRFTEADFALDALNHPDALDNFRVAVGAEQSIYDGGATRARVRAAELGVAQVRGIQEQRVVSTLKHFAVYGIPKGGRDGEARTDPQASWNEIRPSFIDLTSVPRRTSPHSKVSSIE